MHRCRYEDVRAGMKGISPCSSRVRRVLMLVLLQGWLSCKSYNEYGHEPHATRDDSIVG